MDYIKRELERKFLAMNQVFKAVMVTGARQVGKSTMLKKLAESEERTYVNLDNSRDRELAKSDPGLFFQVYKPPILIDEAQKAPELFEHIKMICDASDMMGLFWLTGSESKKLLKEAGDSLAGSENDVETVVYLREYRKRRSMLRMEKESIVYDTANISDIPELVRLRILYMIDDFGSITDKEKEGMEAQLPGYFERELGNKLIAFVARAEGRLVAAAYLLIIEKPANPFFLNGLDSEVLSVYTEEKYRGKGICTKLMSNMIEYAKANHLSRIDLIATDEGYPLYKKLGFEDKVQKYKDMRLVLVNQ